MPRWLPRLLVPAIGAWLAFGPTWANAWAGAPPPGTCAARVGELERRYREVEAEANAYRFLPVSPGFEAPTLADGPPPAQSLTVVELTPTAILFDGRPLEGDVKEPKKLVAAIGREVATSNTNWRILHPGKKAPRVSLGLWINRRIPAVDAVGLLIELSSKYETGLFGMGERADSPDRRTLSASAQKRWQEIHTTTDMAKKSALITGAMHDAVDGCRGSEAVFKSVDPDQPASEAAFHDSILKALRVCDCIGADMDLLEAVTAPAAKGSVHFRPALPRVRAKVMVTLARTATVQDLIARLPASGAFGIQWEPSEASGVHGK